MVFCSKCGVQSPDEMAFCPRCGTRLTVQGPVMVSPPAPPANYAPAQVNYAPRSPPRNSLPLIVVALIIGCLAIVAASALVTSRGTTAGNEDGDNSVEQQFTHGIREGDYADYKVTVIRDSQTFLGTYHISYSNVTETSMTLTTRSSINGHVNTSSTTLNLHDSAWVENPESISPPSGSDSFQVIGTESINTSLGPKECLHTREIESDHVRDDWYWGSCLLKSTFTYDDGDKMTVEISGTNIGGL